MTTNTPIFPKLQHFKKKGLANLSASPLRLLPTQNEKSSPRGALQGKGEVDETRAYPKRYSTPIVGPGLTHFSTIVPPQAMRHVSHSRQPAWSKDLAPSPSTL